MTCAKTWGLQVCLSADRMFIYVLFLCIVYAHEGLNCLDDTLRVPDQVSIGIGGR